MSGGIRSPRRSWIVAVVEPVVAAAGHDLEVGGVRRRLRYGPLAGGRLQVEWDRGEVEGA